MSIVNKLRTALGILREGGFGEMALITIAQFGRYLPLNAEIKRKAGVRSEARFWDEYFKERGFPKPNPSGIRFDPDALLQPRVVSLLPIDTEVRILDVGAGPITCLGKKVQGKKVIITAIDPLADEYDRILNKYQIEPLVRTKKLAAEELTTLFQSNSFDLVYARNCIDHAFDPEKAILEMVDVVKNGDYVLLEHFPNEAENENFRGFHQWNFLMDANGDFLIQSSLSSVNMTRKYTDLATITCEMVKDSGAGGQVDWLITRIQKRCAT